VKNVVTLRDIAEEAGVSHVTVSLALRNQRKISAATTRRIQAIAQRLGYVPDPALGRLNAYRRSTLSKDSGSTLAWINFWPDPDRLLSFEIYAQYWLGAKEKAEKIGYRMDEFRLADCDMNAARLAQILRARGIQGVLIPPSADGTNTHIDLPWEQLAVVRIGYSVSSIPTHLVTNTQFQTAHEATLKAATLGAKRIGYFFHAPGERKTRNHFLGGYRVALDILGCLDPIPPLIPLSSHEDQHRQIFLDWYFTHRPDCILTQYVGIVPWLLESGISIPSDVKIIHLGLPVTCSLRLSGMKQNSHAIGGQAVELLARMLRNGEIGPPEPPIELLVPSDWVAGETT